MAGAAAFSSWVDRLTGPIAPVWTLRRQRARVQLAVLARHYEGGAGGRRTQGWTTSKSDPTAALAPYLANLRNNARDLVRNNPYAESALSTIVDHTVGTGLVAKPVGAASKAAANRARDAWARWAETTACDAEGRLDFYGLQKLVMRTVVESGECLVRRRFRLPEDNLPIPLQLQVLEPDYLDTTRDHLFPNGGGSLVQGVIFDGIGRRIAYQLYRNHPGSIIAGATVTSDRIPASEILHIFKATRPGQVRAASWFAPVILRLKDFDDYEDAALMKQKVAACLAVLTTDVDGSSTALGVSTTDAPDIDELQPGMIANIPPGRNITVVDPPAVSEHDAYSRTVLRAIASGIGVTYEDLTGDYVGMPFSAARMSRLRAWAHVEDWRWRTLIPQFCTPVWGWAMQAARIANVVDGEPGVQWTCPPPPMIDPAAEGLAYRNNIRTGIQTLSEAIRERGYDPDELFAEMAADWTTIDKLGLILDCDPRNTTQAGQVQAAPGIAQATVNGFAASTNGGPKAVAT